MKSHVITFVLFFLFVLAAIQITPTKPVSANNNCSKNVPIFSIDTAPSDGSLALRVQANSDAYRKDSEYISYWEIQEGERIDQTYSITGPKWVRLWWQPDTESTWYLLPSQYWHNEGLPGDLYGVSCDSEGQPSYHTSFGSAIPEEETLPDKQCPLAPVLVSPTNGAMIDTLTPQFEWDFYSIENAYDFWVEVSEYPTFWTTTFVLHDYEINSKFDRFWSNLKPSTTYYWQAYFICSDGSKAKSELWSFTTTANQWLPSSPNLIAPLHESHVEPRGVTLQWEGIFNAIEYQISWGDIDSNSRWIPVTEDTKYHIDSWDLEPNSRYEWSVAARNEYGFSEFSTAVFTTTDQ